ncbi:hypothetical protein BDZ89DRAFT_1086823, partial [Hymenopellis radicata]
DAAWTAVLVLLTIHISFLYNNMSPEVFQVRGAVTFALCPITFTFLQTIPNFLVRLLAFQEVIRSAPRGVGVVFALLVCIPLSALTERSHRQITKL